MAAARFVSVACLFRIAIATSDQLSKRADRGGSPLSPTATSSEERPHHVVEVYGNSALVRRSTAPHHEHPVVAPTLGDNPDGFSQSWVPASDLSAALVSGVSGDAEQDAPLGTMLLLVDSRNATQMKDLEETLVPGLLRFVRFMTPVTVLYSGPFRPVDDATFKLALNSMITLSLVDVTKRVAEFARHDSKTAAKPGKAWKLAEFWTVHVPKLLKLQKYHYVWRLSPRSALTSNVDTDLYEVMRNKQAVFGYRLLEHSKNEACSGLQSSAMSFYQENSDWAPQSVGKRAFLQMFEQAGCPLWTSDFQLVDLDYLRNSDAYGAYTKYLANVGGFSKRGWSEHSVQTLFLATQAEPEKMLCMTPWVPGYHGDSETSCGGGTGIISFFQDSAKHLGHATEALQVDDVTPPAVAKVNSAKTTVVDHSSASKTEAETSVETTTHTGVSKHAGKHHKRSHDYAFRFKHMLKHLTSKRVAALSMLVLLSMLGGGFFYKRKLQGGSEDRISSASEGS